MGLEGMPSQPTSTAPNSINDNELADKDKQTGSLKNYIRAAIVAMGSLLPHPEHGLPEIPKGANTTFVNTSAPIQAETLAQNKESQTESNISASAESSELSTNDLLARYNLATDPSGLEQLHLLMQMMSRDLPPGTREAILKDYAGKNFDDIRAIKGTLEVLDACGVSRTNSPWLKDMLEDFILRNPEQVAFLQPVWPDTPPDPAEAPYLERQLEQYTQFRSAIENMDTPKAKTMLEILDGTLPHAVKEDLMYFVDDIANGTLEMPDAVRIAEDEEQLFEYLLHRAQESQDLSPELIQRLRGLANPYLPRQEKIQQIPWMK